MINYEIDDQPPAEPFQIWLARYRRGPLNDPPERPEDFRMSDFIDMIRRNGRCPGWGAPRESWQKFLSKNLSDRYAWQPFFSAAWKVYSEYRRNALRPQDLLRMKKSAEITDGLRLLCEAMKEGTRRSAAND